MIYFTLFHTYANIWVKGGPFEYWLVRTRAQDLEDHSVIDEFINTLQSGSMPDALRGLSRAASAFPNTTPGR